ncbi:MAG: hypothetical protein H0V66_12800 [Bdellovibrionales bacterium]|nr:hypothetical protein [Bdellovibrionales bacterium]
MIGKSKVKKNIRRFIDDVLSSQLRLSIHEMARSLTREITNKVIAAKTSKSISRK